MGHQGLGGRRGLDHCWRMHCCTPTGAPVVDLVFGSHRAKQSHHPRLMTTAAGMGGLS